MRKSFLVCFSWTRIFGVIVAVSLITVLAGTAAHVQQTFRIFLTGPTTFYIAPASCNPADGYWPDNQAAVISCGSNTSGNGTQTAPYADPQFVHDMLMRMYDLAGYPVTIQSAATGVGKSPYVYPVGYNASGRIPGQGGSFPPFHFSGSTYWNFGKLAPITLQGDIANVTGSFLRPAAGNGGCVTLTEGASVQFYGMICDTHLSGQDGIDVFAGSFIAAGYIWWGNAGCPTGNCGQLHWGAAYDSAILLNGPEWVTGSAMSHIELGQNSSFVANNANNGALLPIHFIGNTTFSQGFYMSDGSQMLVNRLSYDYSGGGVVHGPKFLITRNGVIETGTGGASYTNRSTCNQAMMPGDQAGLFVSGGGICD